MARTRRRQSHTDRLGGFTLIELILVMIVLTIIVGTAMPSVRGFLGWSRSRDALSEIVALTQYARSKAATEAKTYKIGADGTSCWLEVQDGEAFSRVENDDLAAPVEVPDGAAVEFVPSMSNNDQLNAANGSPNVSAPAADGIIFYPDGRTSPGLIRYTSPAGVQSLLGSPSPTESFRVMTPQEAQRL